MIKENLLNAFNKDFELNTFVRLKSNITCLGVSRSQTYNFITTDENKIILLVSIEEYENDGTICVNFIDGCFVIRKSGFFSYESQFKEFFECI